MLTSHPLSNNSVEIAMFPLLTADIKGVLPSLSIVSINAPLFIINCTKSTYPMELASERAVCPFYQVGEMNVSGGADITFEIEHHQPDSSIQDLPLPQSAKSQQRRRNFQSHASIKIAVKYTINVVAQM